MIRLFKREGVRQLVMAGKVPKADLMHRPWKFFSLLPDLRTLRWWYFGRRRDNRDDSILLSVIDEFAADGLRFESALTLCPELLVRPGVLTRRPPTAGEEADIAFGWDLAREMGRLDVGQSVAVKERAVLAVEAIEGTDRAILRAGELCRAGGFTVVKVGQAAAGPALRRADRRPHDRRNVAQGRRPRPRRRGGSNHLPRPGRNRRAGRPLRHDHRGARRPTGGVIPCVGRTPAWPRMDGLT